MHYKDGTPATLGDIIQHDSGAVGIVIGGQIGNDYCSTSVVIFRPARTPDGHYAQPGAGYVGELRTQEGKTVATAAVRVTLNEGMQTREMVKIGHVDLGHPCIGYTAEAPPPETPAPVATP